MADDPTPVVVQKSNWTTIVTIASISGIFVIFIVALWAAGFFKFSGSDPSSKVVAAALALVGGLVAAIVSIIGIVLKYSIDQRTETRLQIEANRAAAERRNEADRANALHTQAELRLNLEAAIRAVELLGGEEGSGGSLQRAGALFALSNLDQHQLTLDLISYLLQNGQLDPHMACSLIDRALKRGDEGIQRRAIMVLNDNADRMVTPSDTSLPRSIQHWDACLSSYVQEWSISVIAKILLARPVGIWQDKFQSHANGLIAALALAWNSKLDERVKMDCGLILRSVLGGFPLWGTIYHPQMDIDTERLAQEVAGVESENSSVLQLVQELDSWATKK